MLQLILERTDMIDSIDTNAKEPGVIKLCCNLIFYYLNKSNETVLMQIK